MTGGEMAHPKHDAALAAAIKDIGQHEEPMGSNNGPYVRLCQAATWLAPARIGAQGWPWCRAAVLKWRKQGGDKPGDLSAGAWDALNRASKRGESLSPRLWREVIPGDEAIWQLGKGHSSLVESIALEGSVVMVHTIDGNCGDRVQRVSRPLSQVRGFIAWPEVGYPVAAKRPLFHAIGSVAGGKAIAIGGKVITLKAGKIT